MTAAPDATRRWVRYLPLLVIAALCIAVIASGQLRRLSLGDIAAHREALMAFVGRHPLASLGAYFAIYVLLVIACVPGPSVMSVTGGFLFGPFVGGAAALTAVNIGSAVVFLACRTAFGDWAAKRAGPVAARIEAGFSADALSYLLAIRLMPVAPLFAVNIAAGLARVRLRDFVIATVLGCAPTVFIFAGLGSGLGGLFRRHVKLGVDLFARPDIALPLTGLALLSLAPAAWRIWRARQGSK